MSKGFNYDRDFKKLDVRKHPEEYQVGKGEQGVLSFEPYKSEILPYWRFKTPAIAEQSAKSIFELFEEYKQEDDFVGMDMTRKFLQMGYTRSRRYANHKSGKKYSDKDRDDKPTKIATPPAYRDPRNRAHHIKSRTKAVLPLDPDPEKAKSAEVFKSYYQQVKNDKTYQELKQKHKEKYG